MKKLLAILLSAMLVFSMVACSNDTPSPEVVEQKPVTELDKVNDKIEAASSAFEDAENIYTTTDESTGTVTQTIKKEVPMDGYTITAGTKTVTVEGKETTELTIEYEEDGKNVKVQNTQSEQVTVTGSELSEDEKKEVSETALTEAKQISAFSFTEVSSAGSEEPSGDAVTRVYEYIPEVAAGRISRAGDVGTIKKVVITFTYNGNYASYKYDITYTWNGSDLTITEEVTKETFKIVGGDDVSDTLKEDLANEFSLSNLQPGGNEYEALNALAVIYKAGISSSSAPEKLTSTITVKTQSGKTLASIGLSSDNLHTFEEDEIKDENEEYIGTKWTSSETSNMRIKVNSLAKELSFIPFLKAGTEITYDSSSNSSGSSADGTNTYSDRYEISVVTDGKTVFSNEYDFTIRREYDNLVSVGSEEESEGSFSLDLGSISMSGTIEESLKEGSNDIIISKSIINKLDHEGGIDLGIKEGDVICQEYSHSEDPNFEETTYILRGGDKVSLSIETLLPQIMQILGLSENNLAGLIELVDGGVSVTMSANSSTPDCLFQYNTPSGNTETRNLKNHSTGSEYSYGLKAGAASKLMELINGASGQEEININEILGYITFSGKETSELLFEEDFYGADHIKTTVTLTAFGEEPLNFAITFYDGYMKGTYNFTPEEYYKVFSGRLSDDVKQ